MALCAAYLELNQLQPAERVAGEFLRRYPDTIVGLRRLKESERAFVTVAGAIEKVAGYCRGQIRLGNLDAVPCRSINGKLDAIDSELFETIFDGMIQRRKAMLDNRNQQEELGVFLGSMISFVRKTCGNEFDALRCPGCSAPDIFYDAESYVMPLDVSRRYELPPYRIAYYSRDKSLGVTEKGQLRMTVQQLTFREREYKDDAGKVVKELFPVIEHVTKTFAQNSSIPDDRYVLAPPAPKPAPAPPPLNRPR
jgi:hypothetical protein